MQCAKPGVFKCINKMLKEQKSQSNQIERLNSGEPHKKKQKKYKNLDERLKSIVIVLKNNSRYFKFLSIVTVCIVFYSFLVLLDFKQQTAFYFYNKCTDFDLIYVSYMFILIKL